MLHAVGITLVRLAMSHGRRLLEWETSAAERHRTRDLTVRTFVMQHAAQPADGDRGGAAGGGHACPRRCPSAVGDPDLCGLSLRWWRWCSVVRWLRARRR